MTYKKHPLEGVFYYANAVLFCRRFLCDTGKGVLMENNLNVAALASRFGCEVIAGSAGMSRAVTVSDLHRPGLELAGYTNYYAENRVQIIGRTEVSFLQTLPIVTQIERATFLCKPSTPCIVVTRKLDVPDALIETCARFGVPLLRTSLSTTALSSRLTDYLENCLAPMTTVHGVLVDVYGVGMLITGASGIGKSETALELVKRGHRLVADDAVEVRQVAINELVGTSPVLIRHLLEIRGLGIINAMTLFGAGAVRSMKKVALVCHLEMWQQDKHYDRLGLDEQTIRIIDTDIPLITVPVRPGRNLAVIIEVAAMNFRLKRMGFHAAEAFSDQLTASLQAAQSTSIRSGQDEYDEIETVRGL
jgi:HPr kinase/phosphorylase